MRELREVGEQRIRIHITGWGDNTDKWEPARSKRLRLAGATRGAVGGGALTLIAIVMILNLAARLVARIFAPKLGR